MSIELASSRPLASAAELKTYLLQIVTEMIELTRSMHNVCFATQKCLDPFFADRFQRLVERCLIGSKAIIPNCGRACFIDHFKRPVGRLKPNRCQCVLRCRPLE